MVDNIAISPRATWIVYFNSITHFKIDVSIALIHPDSLRTVAYEVNVMRGINVIKHYNENELNVIVVLMTTLIRRNK